VMFSLALALATGLLFGLVPALRLASRGLHDALKGKGGSGVMRWRNALVLAEVALAVVLLVGAGLLIRSFDRLTRVDPGFEPENVLTYQVVFPTSRYRETKNLVPIYQQMLERTRAVPGVRAVAISNTLPTAGAGYISFFIQGHQFPARRGASAPIDVQPFAVSPDYLRVMGMKLRRGRFIEAGDVEGAQDVAVVNTEMVRKYFPPGRDPLGMKVTFGDPADPKAEWWTVVGIVDVVAQEGLDAKPYSQIYLPIAQAPRRAVWVTIKSERHPMTLVAGARQALRAVDRELPMNDVASMEDRLSKDVAVRRVSVVVLSVFAALAMVLAAIGIYGVLAYAVAQRTREIGIRMALGADASRVRRLVVRQGMTPAALGLAIGLVAAVFATRLMQKLLYGVTPGDPATLALVALLLGGVALGASYLPARRATRVEPTEALRE
jgi:putative ABC transport system permease protein